MKSERNNHVFITGASSDIGLAVSQKYLESGFSVVGHYNTGQRKFFELAEEFSTLTPVQIDLENSETLETFISENKELICGCSVLINAAALLESIAFEDISSEDILRAMKINLIPSILLMQAMAPAMAKRNWGRIVHVSSIGVKFGGGSASFCYALSKHAQEFMPANIKSWAASDVFVNALRIGVTDTRIHRNDPTKDMPTRISLIPAKRMASPEEIAETIFWYGSAHNTFTTGQTITVAGGE